MTNKILVTGADGFIGSHLVEHLLNEGYSVRALCCYNSFGSYGWLDSLNKKIRSEVDILLGDIRDFSCVRSAVQDCSSILHLASLIAIPYSYRAPESYIDTNVRGTLNVLQAARDCCVEKIVHTSTSETYGSAQFVPITEKHPLNAQSPYAASKIAADQLALSFWHSYQLPLSIIRPFNTYGPRQSARAVIPTIITQIATGTKKIKLGSLTPTRDFSYVLDTCDAFVSILRSTKTQGQVINSASNFEISIGQTANLIAEVMNQDVEIISDEQRVRPHSSEVNRLYGDNTLLRELTAWEPKYIGLDGFRSGLIKTVQWFCDDKNMNFYKPNAYNI